MTQTITVIRGDGIGPEIMDATLHVLDAMQLGLQYEFADAGLAALEKLGELLPAATMDSIRQNRIALKTPLTTPVILLFTSLAPTYASLGATAVVVLLDLPLPIVMVEPLSSFTTRSEPTLFTAAPFLSTSDAV